MSKAAASESKEYNKIQKMSGKRGAGNEEKEDGEEDIGLSAAQISTTLPAVSMPL